VILQHDELTLAVLQNLSPTSTQRSLATQLGYSVGKINYVINALAAKGLIKIENFYTNKNKNQYRYLLTQEGIEEKISLTVHFIERKKAEYDALVAQLESYDIGVQGE
jgi:EPS-associated MarR family transcriptional regulator